MIEVVGRSTEVAAVSRWLAEEGPSCLVLEGEAGLGKTTVLDAAVEAARAQGAAVVASAPSEAESRLAYAGLADLLDGELDGLRASLPRPQAAALAIATRLEDPDGHAPDETAVARGLFEAFRQLAGAHGRLLVAVDDVRLLDGPSLAALTYATRRFRAGDRVRVLVTHRAGEPEPPLIDDRAAVERVRLGPVSIGGIHRIVRLHTGSSLTRPRLLDVYEASAGNPLHALELVRAHESGDPARASSLAGLFRARLAALPDDTCRAVLLLAASADRSADRLERTFAGDWWSAIGPALDRGLVASAGPMIRPAHPLVTQLAYEDARGSERREAHRALAATARTTEERAVHLGRSIAGDDAPAAAMVEAAAIEARSRGARAQSATMFEEAARLTPASAGHDQARRRIEAATAWYAAGDAERVERLLVPLLAELPHGDQRAEAQWRLGIALDERGRWEEATALWREGLADAQVPSLRAELQSSLAITAFYTESVEIASAWAEAAVAEAEPSSSPGALARALAVQALTTVMRGGDHRPAIERALELEAIVDEPLSEWSPSAIAAECARHAGDMPAARRHYTTVLAQAREHGDATVEQWAAFGLAMADVLSGQFVEAATLAHDVLDLAEQTGVMRIPARSLVAHVAAYRGEDATARRFVDEAFAMAHDAGEKAHEFSALYVRAVIETCAGDLPASADAYADVRAVAQELGFGHGTALRCFLAEAETAAAVGRAGQAADALAAFEAAVDGRRPPWSEPLVGRARAAMLAADGRLGEARDELDDAIAFEPQLPIDLGRALLAHGVACRRLREHARARASLEHAVALFDELGTPPFVARARDELARIPGRRSDTSGALTDAEARIAALVAEGRSNREVAAALTISIKTVEVTLTRVYEKLEVRSRTELVARMATRPD